MPDNLTTEAKRRIIACLDAFDGIETRTIENLPATDLVMECRRLREQRDELLAALEHCLREHGGFTIRGETERIARAAIEKCKP